MSTLTKDGPRPSPANESARRFVEARLSNRPLADFPGDIPASLAEGYACQDAAIDLWTDEIAGWKIGRIADALAPRLGANRLAGPIFRRSVLRAAPGETTLFRVYERGFAAIEAEFIFVVGEDAPAAKRAWSLEEARATVADVRIGVELAGSPLATINDLGPTVVISDFGNNAGLILGPPYEGWRSRPVTEWRAEASIDGVLVGVGDASELPGGPFEALRFLLELNASRGRPLRKGDLISTGAVTGVHSIGVGATGRLAFDGSGVIACQAVAKGKARPSPTRLSDRARN